MRVALTWSRLEIANPLDLTGDGGLELRQLSGESLLLSQQIAEMQQHRVEMRARLRRGRYSVRSVLRLFHNCLHVPIHLTRCVWGATRSDPGYPFRLSSGIRALGPSRFAHALLAVPRDEGHQLGRRHHVARLARQALVL